MQYLKSLWGLLKLMKVTVQNERQMVKTLSPREYHERQYIRCVQQMWAADQRNNDRQAHRYGSIAIVEGQWLLERGYPLPVVPNQPHLDPMVQDALDTFLNKR